MKAIIMVHHKMMEQFILNAKLQILIVIVVQVIISILFSKKGFKNQYRKKSKRIMKFIKKYSKIKKLYNKRISSFLINISKHSS